MENGEVVINGLSESELAAQQPYGLHYRHNKLVDIGKQWVLKRSTVGPSEGFPITRISDCEYVVNNTGEVKQVKKRNTRTDDIDSLRKTFERARNIINYNCTEPQKVVFLTLTYRENMRDTTKVYNDWMNYRKRYLLPKLGKHECITALEPQARGAWHMHVLLIFADGVPYINATQARKAWGKGAIHLQRLDDTRNVGAYLSAYLTDLYDTDTHKREKHARLSMYPAGCHIFRWSRGIKKPPEKIISNGQAVDIINTCHIDYKSGVQISYQDSSGIDRKLVKTKFIISKQLSDVKELLQATQMSVARGSVD